jgi:hypothetical protein
MITQLSVLLLLFSHKLPKVNGHPIGKNSPDLVTWLPTYMHTYMHTYIHTYIHTYLMLSQRSNVAIQVTDRQNVDWKCLLHLTPLDTPLQGLDARRGDSQHKVGNSTFILWSPLEVYFTKPCIFWRSWPLLPIGNQHTDTGREVNLHNKFDVMPKISLCWIWIFLSWDGYDLWYCHKEPK